MNKKRQFDLVSGEFLSQWHIYLQNINRRNDWAESRKAAKSGMLRSQSKSPPSVSKSAFVSARGRENHNTESPRNQHYKHCCHLSRSLSLLKNTAK